MTSKGIPYVEFYRPKNLEDIVLDPLNKQIITNIIEHSYFPNLLFYGPPGTGKTTKLIELIREAIGSGVEPDMIGFFSFTNKATEEAKSRMVTEFPQFDIEADFPYFQTIHSLAQFG